MTYEATKRASMLLESRYHSADTAGAVRKHNGLIGFFSPGVKSNALPALAVVVAYLLLRVVGASGGT
jgi:hypothetical protein